MGTRLHGLRTTRGSVCFPLPSTLHAIESQKLEPRTMRIPCINTYYAFLAFVYKYVLCVYPCVMNGCERTHTCIRLHTNCACIRSHVMIRVHTFLIRGRGANANPRTHTDMIITHHHTSSSSIIIRHRPPSSIILHHHQSPTS